MNGWDDEWDDEWGSDDFLLDLEDEGEVDDRLWIANERAEDEEWEEWDDDMEDLAL